MIECSVQSMVRAVREAQAALRTEVKEECGAQTVMEYVSSAQGSDESSREKLSL